MNISINKNIDIPLYMQITNEIRKQIISAELPYGFKLPPERALADDLGVSRNTMVRAYQELISEGLIVVSPKPKGYFVRGVEKQTPSRIFNPLSKLIKYTYTTQENLFADIYQQVSTEDKIVMAGISVKPDTSDPGSVSYRELYLHGEEESLRLKRNICRLLGKQDIFVSEKNIFLVSEITHAIEYIISLYLSEGDTVIVEEPIIPDNVNVFRNKGINVVCVNMTKEGMDLDNLRNLIDCYKPKFIYTMPNLHNPTGAVMPLEKRLELLEISNTSNVPIIEENSLRDFRYEGHELPSLFALDKNKMVLYIDTFTLSFLPGIKTAYVAGPVEPVDVMEKLLITNETTVYNVSHAMLNQFIESGGYERRIREIQDYCRENRDYLCKALEPLRELGFEYEAPEGTPCLWCKLPENINEKKLFALSEEKGLLYMPGSVFYPYGYTGTGHLRLCFSNISHESMDRAAKILYEALSLSVIDFER